MNVRQTAWQMDSLLDKIGSSAEKRLNVSDLMHYLYLRQVGYIFLGARG